VKDNDPKGWEYYLQDLIDDQSKREQMGRDAYKRVKQDFNVKKNAATYMRLLKTIVNQAAPDDLGVDPCNYQNFNHLLAV
jgi:spore maturation protein CgeB